MRPIRLSNERVWRTYLGGGMLDQFHGLGMGEDGHFPEEWIVSTTAARNAGREEICEGLSRDRQSGKTLQECIESSPQEMLGARHVSAFGSTPGVLIKLIDSAERLSIQVHPDKAAARALFSSEYGKTECWHILGGRSSGGESPCIYLGFREGVTREHWKAVFDTQDIPAMLDCLHKIPVHPGDTFLIPGGVPHAIGAGCFLMEIQEPTDYTIRTERTTPSGFAIADSMCHQGIGFEKMFDCFHYEGKSEEENRKSYQIFPQPIAHGEILIGYDRTPCFMLTKYRESAAFSLPASDVYMGLYCLDGDGTLQDAQGPTPVQKGDQFFVPANTPLTVFPGKSGITLARLNGPQLLS